MAQIGDLTTLAPPINGTQVSEMSSPIGFVNDTDTNTVNETGVSSKHMSEPPNMEGTAIRFDCKLYKLCDVNPQVGTFTVDIGVRCRWDDHRFANLPLTENAINHLHFDTIWQPTWLIQDVISDPLIHDEAVTLVDAQRGTLQQVNPHSSEFSRLDTVFTGLLHLKCLLFPLFCRIEPTPFEFAVQAPPCHH